MDYCQLIKVSDLYDSDKVCRVELKQLNSNAGVADIAFPDIFCIDSKRISLPDPILLNSLNSKCQYRYSLNAELENDEHNFMNFIKYQLANTVCMIKCSNGSLYLIPRTYDAVEFTININYYLLVY